MQPNDLNQNALNEFKLLVEQNSEITENWKQTLLQLVSDGLPVDYNSLIILIKGGELIDDSSKDIED